MVQMLIGTYKKVTLQRLLKGWVDITYVSKDRYGFISLLDIYS